MAAAGTTSKSKSLSKSKLSNCLYVTSHGEYTKPSKHITVPENIKLIQYSTPREPLTGLEAKYILLKGCKKVHKGFYLVHKQTGKIYKSTYKIHITDGAKGESTPNLNLQFDMNQEASLGVPLGIKYDDGSYDYSISKHTTLENLLREISENVDDLEDINVVQISCRVGEYDVDDIAELARDFAAMDIGRGDSILDLYREHYKTNFADFYKYITKNFHDYYDKKSAEKKSLQISDKKRKTTWRRTKAKRTRKQIKKIATQKKSSRRKKSLLKKQLDKIMEKHPHMSKSKAMREAKKNVERTKKTLKHRRSSRL
jgi:hypothetical protein